MAGWEMADAGGPGAEERAERGGGAAARWPSILATRGGIGPPPSALRHLPSCHLPLSRPLSGRELDSPPDDFLRYAACPASPGGCRTRADDRPGMPGAGVD